jgi:hypothetical protein
MFFSTDLKAIGIFQLEALDNVKTIVSQESF